MTTTFERVRAALRCAARCGLIFLGGAVAAPAQQEPMPRVTALSGTLEVGYDISVEISGLAAWAAVNDAKKLVPVINGRELRGNYPDEVHAQRGRVHFDLAITAANHAVWVDLLGTPQALVRPVEFSVGLEGATPFPSDLDGARSATLVVIEPVYGWIALGVVVVALVSFFWLARTTEIIRDSSVCPVPGKLPPFNLGRAQMAFWFFLTFSSYIVIWLITDAIDTIAPSLLALMGISAGTALGEVLIDQNKDATAAAKLQAAVGEKQALEQGVAELAAQLAALTAKTTLTGDDVAARDSLNRQLLEQRTRLNQVAAAIKPLSNAAGAGVSRGFWKDILSNGVDYSFHRFQIVGWTFALGGVFVSAVYNTLAMPEFSATMLGLMGMSSGTYIGFKLPEQR